MKIWNFLLPLASLLIVSRVPGHLSALNFRLFREVLRKRFVTLHVDD